MVLILNMDLDNDAFQDHHHGGLEYRAIAAALIEAAAKISQGGSNDAGKVRDVNGNTVGEWEITE